MKNLLLFTLLLFASLVSTAQNPWLVDPDNGDDATADGSAALPYQTIPAAADAALAGGGGEVHIKGGTYQLPRSIRMTTPATAADSVMIMPEPGTVTRKKITAWTSSNQPPTGQKPKSSPQPFS